MVIERVIYCALSSVVILSGVPHETLLRRDDGLVIAVKDAELIELLSGSVPLTFLYFSKDAYQFFYFIASVAILPPYVLSGAYALKLAASGETYSANDASRNKDMLVGALATVYGLWLVYAAGLTYLLMCAVLFAPGILVYAQARRERGEPIFKGFEILVAAVIVLLAVLAAYLMWTGKISPL